MPKNLSESFFFWLRNQIFDFTGKNNVGRYASCVPFLNWEGLGQYLNVWDKCLRLLCPQVLTITQRLTCTSAHRCVYLNGVTLAITSPLAFFSGQILPKTLMCWVFETKLHAFLTVTLFLSSKQLLRAVSEDFVHNLFPLLWERLVDHDETSMSHNFTVLFGEAICCHQRQQESSRGSIITSHSNWKTTGSFWKLYSKL